MPTSVLARPADCRSPAHATTVSPAESGGDEAECRWWTRAVWLLLILGTAWRLGRYLLCFPLYGDEALLAINFLERGVVDFKPLDYYQVAPPLFVWTECALVQLLGPSELALRLLPLLAGVAAPFLFWALSRLVLPHRAACMAAGLLAVSTWPAGLSGLLKPYSLDLFMATALMTLAALVWKSAAPRRALLGLCVLTPIALLFSTTAALIAGAVSAALLPILVRRRARAAWALYALFNLLVLATFAGAYRLWYAQFPPLTRDCMTTFWSAGFPPGGPLAWLGWLLQAHTGEVMAYPAGSQRGGSIVTALLVGVGVWQALRQRRTFLAILALTPFALGLTAAVLGGYPYGVGARIQQHLAPAVCLLAGLGLAWTLERWPRLGARRAAGSLLVAGLACIALAGLTRDLLKPYRTPDDAWLRQTARDLALGLAPGDRIIYVNDRYSAFPHLRWYIAAQGGRATWLDDFDPRAAEGEGAGRFVFVHMRTHDADVPAEEHLQESWNKVNKHTSLCPPSVAQINTRMLTYIDPRPRGSKLAVDVLAVRIADCRFPSGD